MADILVLGAGMVGSAIASDLSPRHSVSVGDLDRRRLKRLEAAGIETRVLDVTNEGSLSEALIPFDLVVGAVPGFLGFRTLQTVIAAGKPVVDISFFPEDALTLNDLAQRRHVVAVVDAGVAPGLDNLILGHHDRSMQVDRFECLVGGLPKRRVHPFDYKAPFSPLDVIEEYTRPARLVEAGRTVTRPALSDTELVDFGPVGTLEAFNTDGLRTLIQTMPHVPNMTEKTLRYPGHIDLIKALKRAGFFSEEALHVNGAEIVPREFTSELLFQQWRLEPNEPEFTIMRVTVEGVSDDEPMRFVYELYDESDPETGISSMARTTGYTCASIVELVLNGHFSQIGVSPPELIGRQVGCFGRVVGYLAERGVNLHVSTG